MMDVELVYVGIFALAGCLFFLLFLLFFSKAFHYHGNLSHIGSTEEEHAEARSHMRTEDVENLVGFAGLACRSSSSFHFVKKLSRSFTAERSALVMPSVEKEFFFEELEVATSSFASSRMIKQGHSGDIYRGVMGGDHELVVIKRMHTQSSYLAEMDVYRKVLNQGFLVPLLGQCLAKEEIFIVYEYMAYGDLASILAKGGRAEFINCSNHIAAKQQDAELESNVNCMMQQLIWPLRMRIARQVAEALVYLHHESKPPLSHRNIQGSSILLNRNFEVRLGSLSDVERLENGELPAYDMYCYGKLLLDLISGLDISGNSRSQQAQAWMTNCFDALIGTPLPLACIGHTGSTSWCCNNRSLLLHLIDKNLLLQPPLEEHHLVEMVQVAKLAKLCMEPTTLQRSSMKGVLDLLTLSQHGVL